MNVQTIKEVTKLIGYEGDFTDSSLWGYRIVKDRTSLFFRHKPNTKQIQITANVDRSNEVFISNKDKEDLKLEINVSDKKPPQQIARDIHLRIMPSLKAYQFMIETQLEKTNEHKKKIKDNLDLANQIIGAEKNFRGDTETVHFHSESFYGFVQASSDTVTLKISSLPIDIMKEVLTVLAKHKDKIYL